LKEAQNIALLGLQNLYPAGVVSLYQNYTLVMLGDAGMGRRRANTGFGSYCLP
jgi:hypothetical protein